jgi:hypothetical protein
MNPPRVYSPREGASAPTNSRMPIRYSIDRALGRLYMTVEGSFTGADVVSVLREIATTPELPDGFSALSDHSRVERPITPWQIVELVELIERFSPRFTGTRWAVVSTRPASYGMMRVLAARVPLAVSMQVKIFFDVARATRWLDVSE